MSSPKQAKERRRFAARSMAFLFLVAWMGAAAPIRADPPGLPSDWIDAYLGGSRALESGDLDEATLHLERAIAILPHNSATQYQLACVRTRESRIDEAFALLATAVRDGFDDVALLDWDDDLAGLRSDPRYGPLRARLSANENGPAETLASELAWRRNGFQVVTDAGVNSIAVGKGKGAELFDTRTAETLAILTRPGEDTCAVAASADGRFVAVAGDLADSVPTHRTHFLRVHDAATGDLLRELKSAGWQATVRFDPDSACLRSKDTGSNELAYDTATWAQTDRAEAPAISATSTEFVDGVLTVLVGEPNARRKVGSIAIEEIDLWRARVVGPDGGAVAVIENNGDVALFDTRTGELAWREPLREHGWTYELNITNDGSILVSSFDGTVTVFSGARRRQFTGPALTSLAIALGANVRDSASQGTTWIGAGDGSLRNIDVATGRATLVFRPASSPIISMDISPDGSLIAYGDARGDFRIVSTADGAIVATLPGMAEPGMSGEHISLVEFSPDGSRCAVAFNRSSVALVDTHRGTVVATLQGIEKVLPSVWSQPIAWTPDGERIAIASEGNRVRIVRASDGRDTGLDWTLDRPITVLRFDPEGTRLWVGTGKPTRAGRDNERAHVAIIHVADTRREIERTIDFGSLDDMGTMGVGSIALSNDVAVVAPRGSGIVAGYAPASGKLLWTQEYISGNPTPIRCSLDASGERVCTSGPGSWTPRVLDARTGSVLLDLRDRELFGLSWITGTDLLLATGSRGLEALDARTGALRWSRVETREGGFLLRAPTGHVDGTADALRRLHLSLPERSWPLDALASRLLDVKKVRAAAAGIPVTPPRMATMPTLSWTEPTPRSVPWRRGDPTPRVRLIGACPDGLVGFEVRVAGRVDFHEGTVLDASQRTIEIVIPEPADGGSVDLRVRAIASSGAMSRALYHEASAAATSAR